MKKFTIETGIILYLLMFGGFSICAQTHGNTEDILRKMGVAIEEAGAMNIEFEMKITDASGREIDNYRGRVEAEGHSFKMISHSFEVFCDGTSKWILNADSDELMILRNDTSQVDIVENPLRFLKSLYHGNSGYKYGQRSISDASGIFWQVEFTPENRRSLYKKLILAVDKSTYLPLWMDYTASDNTICKIRITSLKHVAGWPAGNFVFPESRKSGLHVTDLR